MIYLDNAATTFPKSERVLKAMEEANRTMAVNPGRGSYRLAREANEVMMETRSLLLQSFGGKDNYIAAFTPSITIALNQIILGLNTQDYRNIYISEYEHNAVARPLYLLQQKNPNIKVHHLPLKDDLTIDLERMSYLFSQEPPDAVIVNMMSNVTGYILPFRELFDAAKEYDALTVLDGAQGLGLLPIDLRTDKCDIVAFAGHKSLYGPIGIGGFLIREGVQLEPVLYGGTGSDSLNLEVAEAGYARFEFASQNISAVCGLHRALLDLDIEQTHKWEQELTRYLIEKLQEIEGIRVISYEEGLQIGVVSFTMDGFSATDVGLILDEDFDICVRTGYHCAPYIHDFLKDKECGGTVRVSVGKYNTKEDVDALVAALREIGV